MMDEDDIELILREIDTSIHGKSQKKPTTTITSNAFNKHDTSSIQTLSNASSEQQRPSHKQSHPISRNEVKSSSRRREKDSLAASVDSLLDGLDLLDLDSRRNSKSNDLSDILQLRVENESKKACEATVQVPRQKHKCFSVRLSNGAPDAKACSSIRCVACDFPVIAFCKRDDTKTVTSRHGGVEWSSDVDYLFFRNYYPDPQRLQTKLLPTNDASQGYCCQCDWLSVRQQWVELGGSDARLGKLGRKWVCAGH
ncbi:retinal maintenance-domain-containing protein [Chytriomyces cf. hyalinus JEL632]|nr:retinal maintenance-domain-containing protein [Chytriomyces cf. hyalinus JEL632]